MWNRNTIEIETRLELNRVEQNGTEEDRNVEKGIEQKHRIELTQLDQNRIINRILSKIKWGGNGIIKKNRMELRAT